MNQKIRQAIFDRLAAAIPEPTTELDYSSPFELLIAVVLSAQATDKGVNKATTRLFAVANTPQTILALGLEGLKEYIKTIGLYNAKGENIIKLCRQLLDKHAGQVPKTREELEALAGVGRKTANVILNTAFGHPPLLWIPIYSGFPIAPELRQAKMSWKWSASWIIGCRNIIKKMLTIC